LGVASGRLDVGGVALAGPSAGDLSEMVGSVARKPRFSMMFKSGRKEGTFAS